MSKVTLGEVRVARVDEMTVGDELALERLNGEVSGLLRELANPYRRARAAQIAGRLQIARRERSVIVARYS